MVVNRKRSLSESDIHPVTKRRRPSTNLNIAASTHSPYLSSTYDENTHGPLPADATYSVTRKVPRSFLGYTIDGEQPQLLAKLISDPLNDSCLKPLSVKSDGAALSNRARTSLLLDKCTSGSQLYTPSEEALNAPRASKRGVSPGRLPGGPVTKSSSSAVVLDRDTREEEPLPLSARVSDSLIESIEGTELDTADQYQVTEKSPSSNLSTSSLRELQRLLSTQVSDNRENLTGGALKEWASVMTPRMRKDSPQPNKASMKRLSSDSLLHETGGTGESSKSGKESNYTSADLTRSILYARGVFQYDDERPHVAPKNLEIILQVLNRKRDSVPPNAKQAEKFKYGLRHAINEDSVKELAHHIIPTVELYAAGSDFFKLASKMQWKDVVALCPLITPTLSPPEPDYCISVDRLKFPTLAIENMKGYATPAEGTMAFPIFNIEIKGPDGKMNGAMLQNMQSCSVAVNNILELKKRLGRADEFYGTAHVFSGILNERNFELHLHWAVLKDGRDTFYSREIGVWALRDVDDEQFIAARRAIRNVLDWQKDSIGKELVKEMNALKVQILMPPPPTPSTSAA